ncbi:MAG: hypothetical protein P1T08_12265 [Acidimicrobiia bacterium]|nr:hypothetical protein [Acidimicrobiia bacterium]
MRKSLILVTALAVLVALAAPAAGKGKPPQEPAAVRECAITADGEISLSGTGTIRFECLWTPAESDTGVGTVTVKAVDPISREPVEGPISRVIVFVLDDSPGDICVLEQDWEGHTGPSYTASFDLAYSEMTDPFSWYSNQTYWTWDAGHWCYPQDGDFDMRDDSNGKPLHLRVDFRAKKGTTVEITLSPPQATTP